MGEIAKKLAEEESAIALVGSDNFIKLSDENQSKALDTISHNKVKDGGLMGQLFGTKKENAAMNIAFAMCGLLVIIGIICAICGKDYWDVIIPAITTGMGYIFGKGDK